MDDTHKLHLEKFIQKSDAWVAPKENLAKASNSDISMSSDRSLSDDVVGGDRMSELSECGEDIKMQDVETPNTPKSDTNTVSVNHEDNEHLFNQSYVTNSNLVEAGQAHVSTLTFEDIDVRKGKQLLRGFKTYLKKVLPFSKQMNKMDGSTLVKECINFCANGLETVLQAMESACTTQTELGTPSKFGVSDEFTASNSDVKPKMCVLKQPTTQEDTLSLAVHLALLIYPQKYTQEGKLWEMEAEHHQVMSDVLSHQVLINTIQLQFKESLLTK